MEIFYYRRLEVYQQVKQLAIDDNEILKKFPVEERYALTGQLRRASTSIMFNIAEGFGRYTPKERVGFLDIANGSAMETSSELDLAEAYGYITQEDLQALENQVLIIVRQLAKLRATIKE